MDEINKKIGIIILAAGASTRLGKPKQLVTFHGKTLLENTIQTAINTNCENILVVLGAFPDKIINKIADFPVQFSINADWKSGMGTSIKSGLESLLKINNNLDAVVIMLCDQPFVSSKHIALLIKEYIQTNKTIIATKYKHSSGVPALFSKELFPKLIKLKGDAGAKKLIIVNQEITSTILIAEAEFDVDTNEDLQKLKDLE